MPVVSKKQPKRRKTMIIGIENLKEKIKEKEETE